MNKFGPSKGELWFRVVVSLIGLAMMCYAIFVVGLSGNIAIYEVGVAGGAFFGGTLIWSLWKISSYQK